MSDVEKRGLIVAPVADDKRQLGRGIAESLVENLPGGSLLTSIWRVTHPPQSEIEREEWQRTISDRTNEHGRRLDRFEQGLAPTQELSGTTAQLIVALSRDCPDGLGRKTYELPALITLLAGTEHSDIKDAAFELEDYGFLTLTRTIGGHWWARLTPAFYTAFDEQVMGWKLAEDVAALAELMLDNDEGRAALLHAASGWEKRRFNPAFRVLLGDFPSGRVSREVQPDYIAASISLIEEDRGRLRRLIRSMG